MEFALGARQDKEEHDSVSLGVTDLLKNENLQQKYSSHSSNDNHDKSPRGLLCKDLALIFENGSIQRQALESALLLNDHLTFEHHKNHNLLDFPGLKSHTILNLQMQTTALVTLLITIERDLKSILVSEFTIHCHKQFTASWIVAIGGDFTTKKLLCELIHSQKQVIRFMVKDSYCVSRLTELCSSYPGSIEIQFNGNPILRVPSHTIQHILTNLESSNHRLSTPYGNSSPASLQDIKLANHLEPTREPESPTAFTSDPEFLTRKMKLSKRDVGFLIGINGDRITAIRNKTGCEIKILDISTSTLGLLRVVKAKDIVQEILLAGTKSQVTHASRLIKDCLVSYRDNACKFT